MDSNNVKEESEVTQKKLEDLSKDDIYDIIWNAVNKASKQGVYNIDESYTIKIVFDRLRSLK
jgi:hypothetical protein